MKRNGSINQWRVVGNTVRGYSHIREGLPNQDAIRWEPKAYPNDYAILAVSDGHGSHKSFRSDKGSKIAIDVAVSALMECRNIGVATKNLSILKDVAEEKLPKEIVRQWREGVENNYKCLPFSEEEIDRLERLGGPNARKMVEDDPYIAYGATLIAILVTESFLFFLQIGDGDIITVAESGQAVRPLTGDERLFGNETTSLCSPSAWRDFRSRFYPMPETPPALMLASTDGYSNSFTSEAGFLKVGTDLLKIARSDGIETVENELITWLDEASHKGSGDDITVGVIFRSTLLEREYATTQGETTLGEPSDTVAEISEATSERADIFSVSLKPPYYQPPSRQQPRAEARLSPHPRDQMEPTDSSVSRLSANRRQLSQARGRSENKQVASKNRRLFLGAFFILAAVAVGSVLLFYLNPNFGVDLTHPSSYGPGIEEITIRFSNIDKNTSNDFKEWLEEAKGKEVLRCNEKGRQIMCYPYLEAGQLRTNVVEKLKLLAKPDQSPKKDSQVNVEITIKKR